MATGTLSDARSFLRDLRTQVATHAGVGHSLLGRMGIDPQARADFKIFAGQHYCLVGLFTTYLELLLTRAPTADAKAWLAKVLVDEYGERSAGEDHAALYRHFAAACGVSEADLAATRLHPAVTGFVVEHLRIIANEPFLVGLGAVGPGHEWAIPAMFEQVVIGLRRAGFADSEISYFTVHTVQDHEHGAWLEEALAQLATSPQAQAQIAEGCRRSLAAREALWWGIADKVRSQRMRDRHPQLASATSGSAANEWTLAEFRSQLGLRVQLPSATRDGAER